MNKPTATNGIATTGGVLHSIMELTQRPIELGSESKCVDAAEDPLTDARRDLRSECVAASTCDGQRGGVGITVTVHN
jgi:hypothetical protein